MTRDERQEIARVKWIKNKCCGSLVQPTGAGFVKAVLIEKSLELLLGNIGESPINEDNTEISIETKESIPSYSVDLEP